MDRCGAPRVPSPWSDTDGSAVVQIRHFREAHLNNPDLIIPQFGDCVKADYM